MIGHRFAELAPIIPAASNQHSACRMQESGALLQVTLGKISSPVKASLVVCHV